MRIKGFIIMILSLNILLGLLGCNDKSLDSDAEYIYLPETEILTHQNSSGFHREYKYTYRYDSYGNIVKEEQFTKGFFYSRDYCIDKTYTYDKNGNITKEHIREEHFSTSITDGHFVSEKGYNYFYNEETQLIKKDYIYISTVMNNLCGYKYEYDEQGNCIKEIKYYSDGTEEINTEQIYDSNGKLSKKSTMSHLKELKLHYVSEETEYNYDENENLTYSKTIFNEPSGEMSHYKECKYYYDKQGRVVKEESSIIEKDGKISSEDIREYKKFVKLVRSK